MNTIGHLLRAACLSVFVAEVLLAETPSNSPASNSSVTASQQLSEIIDRQIETLWQSAAVTPAAPATDAEFLRRVYLDLVGTIPPVSVARDFFESDIPTKRAELVDGLLASPGFAAHFARVLRSRLAPEATTDYQTRFLAQPLDLWLRKNITQQIGYDKLVRALLAPSVKDLQGRNGRMNSADGGPSAWFQLKESKPENLASGSARALLGLRIECAQCHDHPFDHWKRDEFWSYAAFFSGIERLQNGESQFQVVSREVTDRRELGIPGTGRVVQARYLDGNEPQWKPRIGARVTLAEWLTSPENPFFARAMANRTWAQFFGTGLVDPVDDMGPHNPPSHPELLDELARQFAAHDFDVRFLMRAIVLSRPYQLTSTQSDPTQSDRRRFARAIPRGLTPEQLRSSLQTLGVLNHEHQPNDFYVNPQEDEFDNKFALADDAAANFETSIIQALELMNGQLTNHRDENHLSVLSAITQAPFLSSRERIETLFLAVLTRLPTPEELQRVSQYLDTGEAVTKKDSPFVALAKGIFNKYADSGNPYHTQALADVHWVLLNSPEFLLNH